mmetsp:Transcript_8449/g.23849  ORF Transcript_8449/g.23849 Transcript_8449/m.23849 type:complete len:222 (-) Transcript_8449:102-767(-)
MNIQIAVATHRRASAHGSRLRLEGEVGRQTRELAADPGHQVDRLADAAGPREAQQLVPDLLLLLDAEHAAPPARLRRLPKAHRREARLQRLDVPVDVGQSAYALRAGDVQYLVVEELHQLEAGDLAVQPYVGKALEPAVERAHLLLLRLEVARHFLELSELRVELLDDVEIQELVQHEAQADHTHDNFRHELKLRIGMAAQLQDKDGPAEEETDHQLDVVR